MADLGGERQALGWSRSNQASTHGRGGRLEPVHRAAALDQPRADDHRHEQRREHRPEEVGQPARPADLRADEAPADAEDDRPGQEVGQAARPDHPARVVDRPGQRQAEQHDQPERDPAFGRGERDPLAGRGRSGACPNVVAVIGSTRPAARSARCRRRSGRSAGRVRRARGGARAGIGVGERDRSAVISPWPGAR